MNDTYTWNTHQVIVYIQYTIHSIEMKIMPWQVNANAMAITAGVIILN